MKHHQKLIQLLNDYGYPKGAIHNILKEIEDLDFEEARKRILPLPRYYCKPIKGLDVNKYKQYRME